MFNSLVWFGCWIWSCTWCWWWGKVKKIFVSQKVETTLCFYSSWQAAFRFIYTANHFLLSTSSNLEERKHRQTNALIYIHEKLQIVNKTDSCAPSYALCKIFSVGTKYLQPSSVEGQPLCNKALDLFCSLYPI